MAIHFQRLSLSPLPGLDGAAIENCERTGLHVLIGRNNAGKTRILKAINLARLRATVKLSDHNRVRRFDHAQLAGEWAGMPPLGLRWPRMLQGRPNDKYEIHQAPHGDIEIDAVSLNKVVEDKPGLGRDFWDCLRAELWALLESRDAILVPTNRYFAQAASLTQAGSLGDPAQWSSVLGNLERGILHERKLFESIAAAFADLTEGLGMRSLGPQGQSVMHVFEAKDRERPMDECGDGLRDLIGIVLFLRYFPSHDVLIDEPGIRLHPHAQRKLLRFLEAEAKERCIWIATHDGPFVGASGVARRYFVHRDAGADKTTATELASRDEARQSMIDLGWAPGDAFLADRVLLCEGESDRIAFQRIIKMLEEDDAAWGGTLVSHLGGSGVVWGDDKPQLLERLRLVMRIAPYAQEAILLDSDGQPKEKVREVAQIVEAAGFQLHMLQRIELENFWLFPKLVHGIMTALAEEARLEQGPDIPMPSEEKVAEELGRYVGDARKGSSILEDIAHSFLLRFSKKVAATAAAACLAPGDESAEALKRAIVEAFAADARIPAPSPTS